MPPAAKEQNGTGERIYKVIMSIAGLCAPFLLMYVASIRSEMSALNSKVQRLEVGQATIAAKLEKSTDNADAISRLNDRIRELELQARQ